MRSLLLALSTVGLLAASTASAAPAVRIVTPPAPPSLSGLPVSSSNGAQSAVHWQQVGPNFFPGRFNCVGSDILNLPVITAGSDGSGYWWGYALADFPGNMQQRGKELGSGIRQITHRLHFPEAGGYYQVVTVIRTDGSLAYSIDDGATFQPCTMNMPPGFSVGTARQLGYDSGSINVDYALVYGTDNNGTNGALMFRSFDGGQTFDFTDFRQTQRAHLWTSRQGAGEIALVWSDGAFAHVELNNGLADPNYWTEVSSIPSPFENMDSDSILVAGQENANSDSLHLWVHLEGTLFRTTDGGNSWTNVREYTTGGERSLGTSLLHKDLVLWGTGDHTVFYSTDGGTTQTQISTDWPEVNAIEGRSVNIDCWSWDFLPASQHYVVRVPSADHKSVATTVTRTLPASALRRDSRMAANAPNGAGAPQEWIYFSTGQGVFRWQLENPTPELAARFGVVTQQVSDLVTLRTGIEKYNVVASTKDAGITGMSSFGDSVPDGESWNMLILSFNNDIGHVLTSKKPEPGDPVIFSDFPFGGITTYGSGLFTGTGVNTSGARHAAMASDPVGPYRFWVVSNALYRETYNRATDTFTEATIPAPVGGVNGQGTGFAIAPSNTARWYLANDLGKLYFSTNSGATWTLGTASGGGPLPVGTKDQVGDNYEIRIVVNPTNALEAWAVGSRVLRTTNGGVTWAPFGTGLPSGIRAYGLAYDPTGVYLASNLGPFVLNGSSWTDLAPANGEMPAVECRCVESLPWAGVVRFGTWGLGVWDYATGATTGVDGGAKPQLALAMRSNPVHDLARLDYTLPRAGRVSLELLDVQGRLIDRLVDGVQPAGAGSATIDASGIGAGVYFARLVTSDGSRAARVVVLH